MKKSAILFLIVLVSCSKDYHFIKNQQKISDDLKKIEIVDQAVRKTSTAIDIKYGIRTPKTVWDSLARKGADIKSVNVAMLPPVAIQLGKLSEQEQKAYNEEKDAGKFLMKYTDSLHLEQIYQITKKYGYPSYDTRPWKNDTLRTGCGFVLTHFHYTEERAARLLKLLIKEYKAKRLTDSEMRYLLWHVNGRFQMSDLETLDINKWIDNYLSDPKHGLQIRAMGVN